MLSLLKLYCYSFLFHQPSVQLFNMNFFAMISVLGVYIARAETVFAALFSLLKVVASPHDVFFSVAEADCLCIEADD